MPYIHSQPSTSTTRLLSSQHHSAPLHDMESSTSYLRDEGDDSREGSNLLHGVSTRSTHSSSSSPAPPTVTLPPLPPPRARREGNGSAYGPRLRSAVRNLRTVRAVVGSSGNLKADLHLVVVVSLVGMNFRSVLPPSSFPFTDEYSQHLLSVCSLT